MEWEQNYCSMSFLNDAHYALILTLKVCSEEMHWLLSIRTRLCGHNSRWYATKNWYIMHSHNHVKFDRAIASLVSEIWRVMERQTDTQTDTHTQKRCRLRKLFESCLQLWKQWKERTNAEAKLFNLSSELGGVKRLSLKLMVCIVVNWNKSAPGQKHVMTTWGKCCRIQRLNSSEPTHLFVSLLNV